MSIQLFCTGGRNTARISRPPMSSEDSDSDHFYDALAPGATNVSKDFGKTTVPPLLDHLDDTSESPSPVDATAVGMDGEEFIARRSRLVLLRRNVAADSGAPTDDDDNYGAGATAAANVECTSLTDAVHHPFRKVEPDAQSLASQLSGRSGVRTALLSSAGSTTTATTTTAAHDSPCPVLQEPDIVSSSKGATLVVCHGSASPAAAEQTAVNGAGAVPVPPPRHRRRQRRRTDASTTEQPRAVHAVAPAPAAAISGSQFIRSVASSLTSTAGSVRPRRFRRGVGLLTAAAATDGGASGGDGGRSMDVSAALRGQCLVRPHDDVASRAPAKGQPLSLQADRLDVASMQSDTSSVTDSIASSCGEWLSSAGVHMLSDSGRCLTDREILDQVSVLNLDTGEKLPLSSAEHRLPPCINPLSLQIMRMTSEYAGTGSGGGRERSCGTIAASLAAAAAVAATAAAEGIDGAASDADDERGQRSDDVAAAAASTSESRGVAAEVGVTRPSHRLRRLIGRTVHRALDRAETLAQRVVQSRGIRDDREPPETPDDMASQQTVMRVPMKASGSHKGPYEFDQMVLVQDLGGEHCGPVWCMKFSACGRLLASAGKDAVLRVWVLKSAFSYFSDMRARYAAEKASPTPSQESLASSQQSAGEAGKTTEQASSEQEAHSPFMPQPLCRYTGHTSDLLDVSWSKNYFLLTSSMDKTVRLWHISRKECLCCFQHIEFVTAIAFHPKDDRYFLSGSLDGKLRLWNIPDKKVALWNELDGQAKLITAANFCQNGRFAVVGSYDGRCVFYSTDQLKYHTQIHVRSSRGRNSRGRKISGIEPMPNEDKILVTSNDSRIRVYDLRDLNLSCKYKGFVSTSSQIKASFSHDGKYIVSGSENQWVYIWRTQHDYSKFSSVRRDRNDFWEAVRAHDVQVTCALFAPQADLVFQYVDAELARLEAEAAALSRSSDDGPASLGSAGSVSAAATDQETPSGHSKDSLDKRSVGSGGMPTAGYVLVSADFNGVIKVFLNRTRPKHSSLPASALL